MRSPSLKDTVQLAIETTGRTGSIAVLSGESILRQCKLDPTRRTAAAMSPEIDRMLRWCEKNGRKLGFISVADGPGSFTGLRIGVTTAKTLSYALGLPLIAVDSLAAIAAAALYEHRADESVLVATNAYRGQVFCGLFTRAMLVPAVDSEGGGAVLPAGWTAHPESVQVCDHDDWQQILRSRPSEVALAGDSQSFGDLAGKLLDRSCDAIGVGLVGFRSAIAGQWVDSFQLVPRYLKPSAAEEKAAQG